MGVGEKKYKPNKEKGDKGKGDKEKSFSGGRRKDPGEMEKGLSGGGCPGCRPHEGGPITPTDPSEDGDCKPKGGGHWPNPIPNYPDDEVGWGPIPVPFDGEGKAIKPYPIPWKGMGD